MIIVEVQELENGDLFIEIPEEVLDELEWKEGDCLSWSIKDESLQLKKL